MKHILALDEEGKRILGDEIFAKILNKSCVLFLGAGASIGEKKYLSSDLITYWNEISPIEKYGTEDIQEILDYESATPDFRRADFDNFVVGVLSKLSPTPTHRLIVQQPWKEIITTNLDLVIEDAQRQLRAEGWDEYQLIPVRSVKQYVNQSKANNEIRYVKLNGCISDPHEYKLAFSTVDFQQNAEFYKKVLKELKNLSPMIPLLTVGYSFADKMGRELLERFDKSPYRQDKWMHVVEPNIVESRLDLWTQQKRRAIKATTEEFFNAYEEWLDTEGALAIRRKRVNFSQVTGSKLTLKPYQIARLGDSLRQISNISTPPYIDAERFYKGLEPTYAVIQQELDVIKVGLVSRIKTEIQSLLSESHSLIPTVFLKGNWGEGKSTLALRLLKELIQDADLEAVAFEIIETASLSVFDLLELLRSTKAKTIILLFDNIEQHSAFEGMRELRRKLSVEQFDAANIIFLATIRENVLNSKIASKGYAEKFEIAADDPFTETEIRELVKKLEDHKILSFRTEAERVELISDNWEKCGGDTLLSIMDLVPDGDHKQIIQGALADLNDLSRSSLRLISILYQYGIKMPVQLLVSSIGVGWDEFVAKVIQVDGKGIILQDERITLDMRSDIDLRTSHRLLAEKIVELSFSSLDDRFLAYRGLAQKMPETTEMASLSVDWFKAIREQDQTITRPQINKLYDAVEAKFRDDPHFVIHYSRNLEHRRDVPSLEKGLSLLAFAASFSEGRNHYIIHRRGVLHFKLAKLLYDEEQFVDSTFNIQEARRFLDIKVILDPFSHFSYADYLELELWVLRSGELPIEEEIRTRVKIEGLLEQAESLVQDGLERIAPLRQEYIDFLSKMPGDGSDKGAFDKRLEGLAADETARPFILILRYFRAERSHDTAGENEIAAELEPFDHLRQVATLLARHYGKSLFRPNTRQKFLSLLTRQAGLKLDDDFRIIFYQSISHFYNRNFGFGYTELQSIARKFRRLDSSIHEVWRDAEGNEIIFKGILEKSDAGAWQVEVGEFARKISLTKRSKDLVLRRNSMWNFRIHFTSVGMKAELISYIPSDFEENWLAANKA